MATRIDSGEAGGWVLTLGLSATGRLVVALSDGGWLARFDEGPWPPAGNTALPPGTAAQLASTAGSPLRLQLSLELDAWPWEREIAALRPGGGVVPRFVLDLLPDAASDAEPPPLQVVTSGACAVAPSMLRAARARRRPLVVVDAPPGDAHRLEVLLRRHWRDSRLLSMALGDALAECPLPLQACRLYGDGRARTEQERGRRPVTAVSIDVVRSTPLVQASDEAYAQRLQAYHELCSQVIRHLQGFVHPPQGNDALMGYFGFPLAVEGSAARALLAAWQLSGPNGDLGLSVRIGVASGSVAVSARQAFGADVHLAARVREVAQPGEVLVARSTIERVRSGFKLVERQVPQGLKDYPSERAVWSLQGVPADVGFSRTGGNAGPFVGRLAEMARLWAAWERAQTGRLEWCCVTGEPGIGKSRLLQEFARELQAEGCLSLQLSGQPQWTSSPFAAVIDGLRRYEGLDAAMGFEQVSAWLEARMRTRGPAAAPGVAGESGGRSSRDLLLDWIAALADRGPFLLLVDDTHWMDPSTMDLLRRVREHCADRPLLVVTGERSDAPLAVGLAGTAPIELQGLGNEDADALAAALGATLSEQVRRRIVERAEGVPLFLEEESMRLRSSGGIDAPGKVPATLEDLLMVRLEALGPDLWLGKLIAVVGRECAVSQLQALLAHDDPFVEKARRLGSIRSLLGSGLLQLAEGPPAVYRFKHALIRDAAYASIWNKDRERLHGLCADLIERDMPDVARQRPEQLALHLEAAQRPDAARRAWQAAAQLAAARQAHAETLQLARRALALDADQPATPEAARATMQMHLLVASAQIALQGYGSEEVETAYQAAEHAGQRLAGRGHALRIRLGLEACYVMRGDLRRAAALAQEVVSQTGWDDEPRLALQARWALANVRFHQGDWRQALAGFDECVQHYRPSLHRPSSVQDPAVMCLGYSSWIQFEIGQADEALARIDRLLALAEDLRHPFSSAVAHSFAASIKRLCGDSAGAWPHALEAQRICDQGDFQVWRAHAWMVRGQLRADRGDVAGGDEDMQRGYERWTGSGARISCATYRITRAEILLRQGRTADAATELRVAGEMSDAIGEHYFSAERLRLQALCAWQAGDRAAAAAGLAQAFGLASRQRRAGLALRCALSAGALDASAGRFDLAAGRLRSVAEQLARHARCRDWRWAGQALAAWASGSTFPARDLTPWEPA